MRIKQAPIKDPPEVIRFKAPTGSKKRITRTATKLGMTLSALLRKVTSPEALKAISK